MKTNRRELVKYGGLLAAAQATGGRASAAQTNLYTAIGVRPVINARGTFTIITGSQTLPEVKRAMDEASRYYVHMDELMEAVGARLAALTETEWGLVTAGCAAAITHITAACIAGANPERMQRLPDLTGLKSEVVIPAYSRNVYDHAIRMLGVKIVEVRDPAALESAFTARTAMAYILAGRGDDGPLGTEAVAAVAKRRGVPLLVDAAAEVLTIPNVHLKRGATAVAYSGGKCIRGPQSAGFVLGEKSLLAAAWLNSAPHHAFGRSLKVGKEEIMGMLAAVEAWKRRDHAAEWKTWETWIGHIAARVEAVAGVTTEARQPQGLSNRSPALVIRWDAEKLGIAATELHKLAFDTEPRIVLASAADRPGSSVSVMPYMLVPGDERIVANKLHALLSKPPRIERGAESSLARARVQGQWDIEIAFGRGEAMHSIVLEQNDAKLTGTHRGEMTAGDLTGTVSGGDVRFRSSHKYEGTSIGYDFSGKAVGERLEGTVYMGEYGTARWTARRHKYPG